MDHAVLLTFLRSGCGVSHGSEGEPMPVSMWFSSGLK